MLTLVDLLNLHRFLHIKSVKALGNVHSKLVQPNSLQSRLRGGNKQVSTCMLQRIATTTPWGSILSCLQMNSYIQVPIKALNILHWLRGYKQNTGCTNSSSSMRHIKEVVPVKGCYKRKVMMIMFNLAKSGYERKSMVIIFHLAKPATFFLLLTAQPRP